MKTVRYSTESPNIVTHKATSVFSSEVDAGSREEDASNQRPALQM
jgi:hypothetical protein